MKWPYITYQGVGYEYIVTEEMEAETEEVYSDDDELCTVNITASVKYLLRFYGKFKATRQLLQWIGRQVLYRQTNNKGKTLMYLTLTIFSVLIQGIHDCAGIHCYE